MGYGVVGIWRGGRQMSFGVLWGCILGSWSAGEGMPLGVYFSGKRWG